MRASYLAGLLCATLIVSHPAHSQEGPSLEITSTATLNLRSNNITATLTDNLLVEGERSGSETSECAPYGRSSFSRGRLQVAHNQTSLNRAEIIFSAATYAHGGHFRTCATCLDNPLSDEKLCVAIKGNDTSSEATGEITVIVRVVSASQLGEQPYNAIVNLNRATESLSIIPSGNVAEVTGKENATSKVYRISDIGSAAFLTFRLRSSSSDRGGCCNQRDEIGPISVSISLEPAPIMYSLGEGYIRGGTPTDGYKNVGAVTLDGQAHCTGTLIGKRTVLTAAHCIALYQEAIAQGRMLFGLGDNANQPTEKIPVEKGVYPSDPNAGFEFNFTTYEDDIGLLYLSRAPDVPPAIVHLGKPNWEEMKRTSLIFVGFGYNVIDGDRVGAGVKREAAWKIDEETNRTIRWRIDLDEAAQSTCKGDSGGPAFFATATELLLVAITSHGDSGCSQGVNMKADAYLRWLQERII